MHQEVALSLDVVVAFVIWATIARQSAQHWVQYRGCVKPDAKECHWLNRALYVKPAESLKLSKKNPRICLVFGCKTGPVCVARPVLPALQKQA